MTFHQETLQKFASYPKIQDKLRAELSSFRERNGGSIGYEDLNNLSALPYLDAIMKEAFRVLASVPQISREVRSSFYFYFHNL